MTADGPNGSGSTSAVDVTRLYRRESVITDADLRVDVAAYVTRVVQEDQAVSLESEQRKYRGHLSISRGSRDITVNGRYTSRLGPEDTRLIEQEIVDKVKGTMLLMMRRDNETLMAGAYVNTITGAYVRMCGWADFLCWGGWAEADVVRIEMAAMMIRAYWVYAHAVAAKIVAASVYVDDFELRNETFAVFNDSHLTLASIGSPGSGETLET